MKISAILGLGALVSALWLSGAPSHAREFWRGGHICQRASSGYIVCRDPRDHYSQGYVIGGRPRPDRDRWRRRYYGSGYRECQRASSGYIVCRDPRDHWSQGHVVGR